MRTADTVRPTSTARRFRPPPALLTAGILILVIGQVVYQAGQQAGTGFDRSMNYLGPASLLGDDPTGHGATLIGAIVSLLGVVVLLLSVYHLTSTVDLTARTTPGATPAPSAVFTTAGLVTLGVGHVVYQAGQQAALVAPRPAGWLGAATLLPTASTGQGATVIGAIVLLIGLACLLLGLHRLVSSVDRTARAALGSTSGPSTSPAPSAPAP